MNAQGELVVLGVVALNHEVSSFCKGIFSSIHVYLFLQHEAQICPTWMTSCMQFEKTKGQSFRTIIWCYQCSCEQAFYRRFTQSMISFFFLKMDHPHHRMEFKRAPVRGPLAGHTPTGMPHISDNTMRLFINNFFCKNNFF